MKKQIKIFLPICLAVIMLGSCSKDFMNRYPLDAIVDQNMWKNENDLTLYVNAFYPDYIVGAGSGWGDGLTQPRGYKQAGTVYGDAISDNGATVTPNAFLGNQYTDYLSSEGSAMGYSYANIRAFNFFIANYGKTPVSDDIKNRYLGEVLFFKAWDYFDKIKLWGEVPWLSTALETNSEELFAPKTERGALLDSVIACVNKSIEYLPEKGSEQNNRVNKQMALFLKARIGLYEGTFRKYHNLSLDANKFLRYSTDASEQLIGKYSLVQPTAPGTSNDKNGVYFNLFATESYEGNPEVILWRQYNLGLQYGAAFSLYFTMNFQQEISVSSLVEEYLCTDGKTISSSPLYKGKGVASDTILQELLNRDPRLTQSVANFGTYNLSRSVTNGTDNAPYPNIQGTGGPKCVTGYRLAKWFYNNPVDWDRVTNGQQAGLMWRYAEVLLNYAEAKYELGELTQGIVDNTINQLRDRVGMPHLVIGAEPVDARLDNYYATYVGATIPATLREIRRERRTEMAFENLRWDDLVRWKAGGLINVPLVGIKFSPTDYPATSTYSKLVVGKDLFTDANGNINPYAQVPNARLWNDRMYLFPFPIRELVLNKNLVQNPGWDKP